MEFSPILANPGSRAVTQNFKDCKVIPSKALTTQHRILVGCIRLSKPIKYTKIKIPTIKWHLLSSERGNGLVVWFGHVMRQDKEFVVRKGLAVQEKKRRLQAPWWTTVAKDMEWA
ncbi:hypothetical protein EVAR_95978_1 [Eumeta japonica]|uniref:Uncharacterized protein n=1 Tax=Eumeta variegata TaxID=151549 RepID=A0A4C1V7R5_EUMVA|nr:hypothetical protein EVAR_95978_1 [Eumeta japonica]